ncbi:sushi domain-containing protein 3 isoform X2 [Carassius gibelio]|uniref:sushi domain-containing protein 3 isoform X2 n=1 Tax=Carassius gibelio TaxID=101364 RepID=UPI0022795D5A|nr:sushi domain-containing protein 3 isoform X2 [Carassius gibelio]
MTSALSLMWVVCGLTVWFPHTHGASVNPNLLMTASDPTTDEQPINPEHPTESTDPPSNNTASLSPNLLIPTFDSTTDEQPVNPEHPTEPTDLFSNNDTASVSSIMLMTTSDASTDAQSSTPKHQNGSTDPPSSNNTGHACIYVLPPRRGSYYVEHGTGVSVGSMLVFWCKEGYQLVGHEKITCILHAGVPRWSSYLPVCESIPRPNDQGLRIALLVSVVSGVVILVMTVCFLICCCQECMRKKKEKRRMGRSRRKETWSSRSRRSPSWLEREHIDWEAFPPPKLFGLSQRLDQALPPGSSVYSEVTRAYENRGYERSQESLLRRPHSTYTSHHANSQIYPALVFQRVPNEPIPSTSSTSPVYIQISTPPENNAPQALTVTHP